MGAMDEMGLSVGGQRTGKEEEDRDSRKRTEGG